MADDAPPRSPDDADAETGTQRQTSGPLSRRALLRASGSAALLTALAGCGSSPGGDEETDTASTANDVVTTSGDTATPTTEADTDRARELAERYAPDLFFGARERWFPTDPRPYATQRDGETVVSGFDAFDGYVSRAEDVPDPTVFYRVVDYGSELSVVQFWFYSVFDQFTTNFHWHDWELLQTFVDTERDEAVLHAASAHSGRVPNNEFVEPGEGRPAILSEVGSHSSALGLNEERESFQRLPTADLAADITNQTLGEESNLPFAYGLPRDEGLRLPFVVPELDGAPVYEHERLPNVEESDLLPADVTVRSFDALSSPPSDIPARETGAVLTPDDAGDVQYDLVPTSEVEDISAFTGPQLSFEFAIPSFAEDLIAEHLSTPGVPWTQERYTDPVVDVTDPSHRAFLADRYEGIETGGVASTLVASLRQMQEAGDEIVGDGLSLLESTVEGVVLLESEPTAVPTWRGQVGVRDVPDGDHRLTVNAPGLAPYTEQVTVEGTTRAGTDGTLPLVANEQAVKVESDGREENGLSRVRVADDNAGVLIEGPPTQSDRFGAYVHRSGAYVVEVRDRQGSVGADRVRPGGATEPVRASAATGKAPLSSFLSTYLDDLRADLQRGVERLADDGGADSDERGNGRADEVLDSLDSAARGFERAASIAQERRSERANERLQTARENVRDAAAAAATADLPDRVTDLLERRFPVAERYVDLALDEDA